MAMIPAHPIRLHTTDLIYTIPKDLILQILYELVK